MHIHASRKRPLLEQLSSLTLHTVDPVAQARFEIKRACNNKRLSEIKETLIELDEAIKGLHFSTSSNPENVNKKSLRSPHKGSFRKSNSKTSFRTKSSSKINENLPNQIPGIIKQINECIAKCKECDKQINDCIAKCKVCSKQTNDCAKCKECEKLKTLLKALKHLETHYAGIIEKIKSVENPLSLLELPPRIFLNGHWYQLPFQDLHKIIPKEVFEQPNLPDSISVYNGFLFKFYPIKPGNELAVQLFSNLLWDRDSNLMSLTKDLFFVGYKDFIYLTLITHIDECQSFQNYINKEGLPRDIRINDETFSKLFLLVLLFLPEDDKFSKYVVPKFSIHNKFDLTRIGDGKIFAKSIEERRVDKQHITSFCSFLFFFFEQMNESLHKKVRKKISKKRLSVELFMMEWLHLAKQQDDAELEKLVFHRFLESHEISTREILLCFPKGAIFGLYKKLKFIQKLLEENPKITHRQIAQHLEPGITEYYSQLSKKLESEIPPHDTDDLKYHPMISGMGALLAGRETFESLEIDQSLYNSSDQNNSDYSPRESRTKQSVEQCQIEWLRELDFSLLDEETQKLILKNIPKYFATITEITLNRCTETEFIGELIAQKRLTKLTLIACSNITFENLMHVVKSFPDIHICFGKCKQLEDIVILTKIINSQVFTRVSYILPSGKQLDLKPRSKLAFLYPFMASQEYSDPEYSFNKFLRNQNYASEAFLKLEDNYIHYADHGKWSNHTIENYARFLSEKETKTKGSLHALDKQKNRLTLLQSNRNLSVLDLRSRLTELTIGDITTSEDVIHRTKNQCEEVRNDILSLARYDSAIQALQEALKQPENLLPSTKKERENLNTRIESNDSFTPEDPIFFEINKLLKQIEQLRLELNRFEEAKTFCKTLNDCIKYYTKYINSFCRDKTKRKDLLLPRPRILTPEFGVFNAYYVSYEKATEIQNNTVKHTGLSRVTRFGGMHFKDPQSPGVELFIGDLYREIIGEKDEEAHQAALVIIELGNTAFFTLTSKTQKGLNVEEYTESECAAEDLILEDKNYSKHFCRFLISLPGDQSLANCIAKHEEQLLRVTSIDNDRIGASVVKKVGQPVTHTTTVRSFIPLLRKNREKPINSEVREHLLSQSPALIIMRILYQAHQRNLKYAKFISQVRGLEEYLAKGPYRQIPLRLLKGYILEIYKNITRLQNSLKKNERITLLELFEQVNAPVAAYYEALEKHCKNNVKAIMKALNSNEHTFESLGIAASKFKDCHVVSEEAYYTWQRGTVSDATETPLEAVSSWLAEIDWSELGEETQREMISKLPVYFSEIPSITIKNCKILNDQNFDLLKSFTFFKNIEELRLISCPNVSLNFIKDLLKRFPQMHLYIYDCEQLNKETWQALLKNKNCKDLSLGINQQEYIQIKPQSDAVKCAISYWKVWSTLENVKNKTVYKKLKEVEKQEDSEKQNELLELKLQLKYLNILINFLDIQGYGFSAFTEFCCKDTSEKTPSARNSRRESAKRYSARQSTLISGKEKVTQLKSQIDSGFHGFVATLRLKYSHTNIRVRGYITRIPLNLRPLLPAKLKEEKTNFTDPLVFAEVADEIESFPYPDGKRDSTEKKIKHWKIKLILISEAGGSSSVTKFVVDDSKQIRQLKTDIRKKLSSWNNEAFKLIELDEPREEFYVVKAPPNPIHVYLISEFDRLLSGNLVTPLTELIQVSQKKQNYTLSIFNSHKGQPLKDYLQNDLPLEKLNHEQYCYHVISLLLLNLASNNLDHFMVASERDIKGEKTLTIFSIINTINLDEKSSVLDSSNDALILLCLNQIREPIDTKVIDSILALDKYSFLHHLLSLIKAASEKYEAINPSASKLVLPNNYLKRLFLNLEKLQVVFKPHTPHTKLNLLDLLRIFEPQVASIVESLFNRPKRTPLKRLKKLKSKLLKNEPKLAEAKPQKQSEKERRDENTPLLLPELFEYLELLSKEAQQTEVAIKDILENEGKIWQSSVSNEFKQRVINEITYNFPPKKQKDIFKLAGSISLQEFQVKSSNSLDLNNIQIALHNSFHTLTVLRLSQCRLVDSTCLDEIAKKCKNLEELVLTEMTIEEIVLTNEFAILRKLRIIGCVDLNVIQFSASILSKVKLKGCIKLPRIDVYCQRPFVTKFKKVDTSLQEQNEDFKLYYENPLLIWALCYTNTSLENLTKNKVFMAGILSLLKAEPHLKIRTAGIGETEIAKLIQILPFNENLVGIQLDKNNLSDNGTKLLIEFLISSHNSKILTLSLQFNDITNASADLFAKFLASNKYIKQFDIMGNTKIDATGMESILKGLKHNSSLISLQYSLELSTVKKFSPDYLVKMNAIIYSNSDVGQKEVQDYVVSSLYKGSIRVISPRENKDDDFISANFEIDNVNYQVDVHIARYSGKKRDWLIQRADIVCLVFSIYDIESFIDLLESYKKIQKEKQKGTTQTFGTLLIGTHVFNGKIITPSDGIIPSVSPETIKILTVGTNAVGYVELSGEELQNKNKSVYIKKLIEERYKEHDCSVVKEIAHQIQQNRWLHASNTLSSQTSLASPRIITPETSRRFAKIESSKSDSTKKTSPRKPLESMSSHRGLSASTSKLPTIPTIKGKPLFFGVPKGSSFASSKKAKRKPEKNQTVGSLKKLLPSTSEEKKDNSKQPMFLSNRIRSSSVGKNDNANQTTISTKSAQPSSDEKDSNENQATVPSLWRSVQPSSNIHK